MYFIFDIGRTKTRVGWSDDGTSIISSNIYSTARVYETTVQLLNDEITTYHEQLTAIVGATTGWFGWGEAIQQELEEVFGVPVHIGNDADFAGLGEAVYGVGKESSIMAYITVSSGVGGSRIIDKHVATSYSGFSPGKQYIDFDMSASPEARGATIEEYISGNSLEQQHGVPAYEIQDENIWNALALYTGVLFTNVAVMWSPDTIVAGGSMITGTPAIDIEKIKTYMQQYWTRRSAAPRIVMSSLGDINGLYGALVYIQQYEL